MTHSQHFNHPSMLLSPSLQKEIDEDGENDVNCGRCGYILNGMGVLVPKKKHLHFKNKDIPKGYVRCRGIRCQHCLFFNDFTDAIAKDNE